MATSQKVTPVGKTRSDGPGRYITFTSYGIRFFDILTLSHSRFHASGKLFTIIARDSETWIVHDAVLSQSPVLARMCQTPMSQAQNQLIKLPEDDPNIFGRVLEYLYCGDYNPSMTCTYMADGVTAKIHLTAPGGIIPDRDANLFANMYIMADKYQLELLQELTIRKIKLLHTLTDDAYYAMVHKIYESVPSSDVRFRAYFMDSAPLRLRRLQAPELTRMLEKIEAGGALARDCFEAQHKAFMKEKEGPR